MPLSLARATLLHEWPRFLPGVLSVAFAGILMLVQLGLLLGMFGTVSVLIDSSDAQIWITSPETQSFDESRDIPTSLGALIRSQPEIERSDALRTYDAEWRLESRVRVGVVLVGLDAYSDAPSCPEPMRTALCSRLAEPMAVVVDRAELDKLGAELGALAEINGHRVRVAGISQGLRAIGATYVFASTQTLRAISEAPLPDIDSATFILARIKPGTDLEALRDRLQNLLRPSAYRVWSREEFSTGTQRYWLTESGVGAGFLFSSLLGLIIGIVITSQTLRAVILASLREYATFRAIGVPSSKLGAVVLEQSLWIGIAGATLTLLLSALIVMLAHAFYIPLKLTGWAIFAAVVIGIFTAGISGLLALRALYKVEPAVLLR